MKKFEELKGIINGIEEDFAKFYDKGNKAAGTRARKAMADLRNLAQDIRKEIQEIKNNG